jgi:hypothetical protein
MFDFLIIKKKQKNKKEQKQSSPWMTDHPNKSIRGMPPLTTPYYPRRPPRGALGVMSPPLKHVLGTLGCSTVYAI